jgi:CheY-like chemotaxis protein
MAKILLATSHEQKALREGLPDLIIADVDLPGLDAFELVETL